MATVSSWWGAGGRWARGSAGPQRRGGEAGRAGEHREGPVGSPTQPHPQPPSPSCSRSCLGPVGQQGLPPALQRPQPLPLSVSECSLPGGLDCPCPSLYSGPEGGRSDSLSHVVPPLRGPPLRRPIPPTSLAPGCSILLPGSEPLPSGGGGGKPACPVLSPRILPALPGLPLCLSPPSGAFPLCCPPLLLPASCSPLLSRPPPWAAVSPPLCCPRGTAAVCPAAPGREWAPPAPAPDGHMLRLAWPGLRGTEQGSPRTGYFWNVGPAGPSTRRGQLPASRRAARGRGRVTLFSARQPSCPPSWSWVAWGGRLPAAVESWAEGPPAHTGHNAPPSWPKTFPGLGLPGPASSGHPRDAPGLCWCFPGPGHGAGACILPHPVGSSESPWSCLLEPRGAFHSC